MDYASSQRSRLRHNGFAISQTFGRSMRPLIWGGRHCVAVVPIAGEPSLGDLLLFVRNLEGGERNIVHRLVEIRKESDRAIYVTRGDNCLGCEYVKPSEIIGRVAEVHRVSGFRPWYAIPAKKFTVTDKAYLCYSRFWAAIWPLRRIYYRLRGHLYSLAAHQRAIFRKS